MPTDATTPAADQRPLDRATVAAIAEAFRPQSRFGNRGDYYYTRGKLGSDPLYPGVLDALRGCDAPLLDLGCGLGLLLHALRSDGQHMQYLGVDIDAGKIARARRGAQRAGLAHQILNTMDLGQGMPAHHGSVAVLDTLQYLDASVQQQVLQAALERVSPTGRLVIRTPLADQGGRDRTTRITDMLAHLVGWMGPRPRHYPTAAELKGPLEAAGLQVRLVPMYGNTPFNNWMLVAARTLP